MRPLPATPWRPAPARPGPAPAAPGRVALYATVVRATVRRMTTYRGATFAGVVTNTVFGFIISYVMLAVFRQQPEIGGFDARDGVTFVWVAQALIMVVGIFGDEEMALRIRTGEVVMDLCRPYDYQGWWAAVHYGKALFYAGARGVPPFIVGALVLGVRLPAAPGVWAAFAGSLLLAVGIAFAWGFLLQLSAFWILDVKGPIQLGWGVAMFLSGFMVPLTLFPAGLAGILRVLPFAAIIQLPIEVFLGKHTGAGLAGVYLAQLAWLAALVALGRVLLARAVRRVVVQGG